MPAKVFCENYLTVSIRRVVRRPSQCRRPITGRPQILLGTRQRCRGRHLTSQGPSKGAFITYTQKLNPEKGIRRKWYSAELDDRNRAVLSLVAQLLYELSNPTTLKGISTILSYLAGSLQVELNSKDALNTMGDSEKGLLAYLRQPITSLGYVRIVGALLGGLWLSLLLFGRRQLKVAGAPICGHRWWWEPKFITQSRFTFGARGIITAGYQKVFPKLL